MKILHLGDLHIGKKVNGFCMLEEQKYVLQEALELIKNEKISSVLISGDVFDKPIPQVFALNLFSQFLSELNKLKIKVFIISGNHDNLERLSYLNELLKSSNIYIAGIFKGEIEHYDIEDGVTIYLMPYLYPLQIKKYFPDSEINSYNDAIKVLIDNTILDKGRAGCWIWLIIKFFKNLIIPLLVIFIALKARVIRI